MYIHTLQVESSLIEIPNIDKNCFKYNSCATILQYDVEKSVKFHLVMSETFHISIVNALCTGFMKGFME